MSKILTRKIIFFDLLSFFWCIPKVGSLFVSENDDPKIDFLIFFLDFLSFFLVSKIQKSSDNSDPKN